MSKEIWKNVLRYDGKYQVSNHGNVRQVLPDGNCKLLKLIYHKDGYAHVNLYKIVDGTRKRKFASVHILVAEVFVPNPENKPEVNHKDTDKHNNFDTNLEWATRKENARHAIENGCRSKTPVEVQCLQNGKKYRSMAQAEQLLGLYKNAVVRSIRSGKPINGYTFIILKRTPPKKVKKLFQV